MILAALLSVLFALQPWPAPEGNPGAEDPGLFDSARGFIEEMTTERRAAASQATSNYTRLFAAVDGLVAGFAAKHKDGAVMVASPQGPYADLLAKALIESLLAHEIEKAHTREEVMELREIYKQQGIDVYQDRGFQRLLRTSKRTRLTLELENHCELIEDGIETYESCVMWIRGRLPTSLVFAEHQTYLLPKAKPLSPYSHYQWFLALLVLYALLPPLLHRIDIELRHPDGSWRAVYFLPFHLVGNRLVVAVLLLSFLWIGPICYELWMEALEPGVGAAGRYALIAGGAMLGLNFVGALIVAMWRDRRHGCGISGTFRELFVLHPHFWSASIESRGGS